MRNNTRHVWLCVALATTAVACADGSPPTSPRLGPNADARASANNGGAPTKSGFELVSDEICPGIRLDLEVSGKAKTLTIGKAGAVTIFLSPGQDARLTNVSTGKSVTLSIAGAFHQSVDEDGNIVTVITGRNLTYDPVAPIHFALTAGVFSYVLDPDGNLVRPRDGTGLIIDACALIA